MFPDLEKGNIAGGAVGLLIPESVTEVDRWGDSQLASLYMTKHSNSREIFESLLAELTTSFKTQEDVETEYAEYREFSSSLANGLVSGAEVVGESSCSRLPSAAYLFWSLQAEEW